MPVNLSALQQRVDELEKLADEVLRLAERFRDAQTPLPELSVMGQRWYRGTRELLVQHEFSGLAEFDACYDSSLSPEADRGSGRRVRFRVDLGRYFESLSDVAGGNPPAEDFKIFSDLFRKARALFVSVIDEVRSRALPMWARMSLSVSADELDKADQMLAQWSGDEAILRASGVIAGVALERHLFTLAETRSVPIIVNPPSKKAPSVEDILVSLEKAKVITPIQKGQLDGLFRIRNACAHPKERPTEDDVKRLIREGRQLASLLV